MMATPLRRRRRPALILSVLGALLFASAAAHVFSFLRAASPAPARAVSAHVLFEALLRATVAGGAAVVAARGSGAAAAAAASVSSYPDGTAELHTSGDAASSAALSAALSARFPQLTVVDEERVAGGGGWRATQRSPPAAPLAGGGGGGGAPPRHPLLPFPEIAVWVDPLDATQEFSEGRTEFVTVSACLTRCGAPIAAALYAPFLNRLYWARPGSGAQVAFSVEAALDAERALPHGWGEAGGGGGGCCAPRGGAAPAAAAAAAAARNASAAAALAAAGGGGLRVAVSRSHAGGAGSAAARALAAAAAAAGAPPPALAPAGGAGYKLLRVLEGHADAYLHGGALRAWDVCAGEALLREAGGVAAQLGGAAVDYCLPPLPPPPRLGAAGAAGEAAAAAAAAARAAAVAAAVAVRGFVAAADPAVAASVLRAVEGAPLRQR